MGEGDTASPHQPHFCKVQRQLRHAIRNLSKIEYDETERLGTRLGNTNAPLTDDDARRHADDILRVRERRHKLCRLLQDVSSLGNEDEALSRVLAREQPAVAIVHRGLATDWGYLVFAFLFELAMILLYWFLVDYKYMNENAPLNVTEAYELYSGVAIMMLIGFGYLMTFLRRHGYCAVGLTFLVTVLCTQWGTLCIGFFDKAHHGEWSKLNLNMGYLTQGMFAAAAVLISLGAVIGKVSTPQIIFMLLLEVPVYALNQYIGYLKFKVFDAGGSIFIHMFGAYFGLAVSATFSSPTSKFNAGTKSRYHSDWSAMIGSIFLWIYWPSFNAATTGNNQYLAVLNTVLSLCSCIILTFVVSKICSPHGRLDMVHVQNSTLAGGVAVGALANLTITPGVALLVGAFAGTLSVVGYVFVTPWLERRFGLQDTCGIHNLHGMPAMLSAIGTIAATTIFPHRLYGVDSETFAERGRTQAGWQLAGISVTLSIAITSGLMVGFLMRKLFARYPAPHYFSDRLEWEVPENIEDPVDAAKFVEQQQPLVVDEDSDIDDVGVSPTPQSMPPGSSREMKEMTGPHPETDVLIDALTPTNVSMQGPSSPPAPRALDDHPLSPSHDAAPVVTKA